MRLFNFTVSNCSNCNKCVRECPVKAICFVNNEAQIDEDKCIACGHCFKVCPRHARNMANDIDTVKNKINSGTKTIACLDSAYLGIFKEPGKFITGLRKLGFDSIQEIAVASERAEELYIKYINENAGRQKYFITSTCPAIYIFIKKYHPQLEKYLLPVAPPMILLGRAIKAEEKNSHTVYIGPCLSKKYETFPKNDDTVMNSHITLVEIMRIMRSSGIDINTLEPTYPDRAAGKSGENYSIAGDIWQVIREAVCNNGYDYARVQGIENVKLLFESMENNTLEKCFVGISACIESCINGPFIPKNTNGLYCRRQKIKAFAEHGWGTRGKQIDWDKVDSSFEFRANPVKINKASEKEITEILRKMGKKSKADEYNCGGCGYDTCRKKAQAVYEGMDTYETCWQYMKQKAKIQRDVIFLNSVDILFLLDKNLNVIKLNPVGLRKFGFNEYDIVGKYVTELGIDDKVCKEALNIKRDYINIKIYIEKQKLTVLANFVYIDGGEIFVSMRDITDEEKQKKEISKLRMHTVYTAQNVIEKQMRVAQEIASVLGETTAETKVVLNRLKEIVMKEEDE
ncbi:MAG: 4Fe-4S binding protein [Clostridia bacterium]|jgi:iron only hydrogenase large subunit-like protein/uncharacterized Fe-S cluster-containing protein|nr:4Fe-4S binding protein [Clostridia bacterium]